MLYLLSYILLISLITFIIFGIDKVKAKHQKRRISENNLLTLVVLGGGLGALLGMEVFRHKTIKGSFLWKFWGIIILRIIILIIALSQGV